MTCLNLREYQMNGRSEDIFKDQNEQKEFEKWAFGFSPQYYLIPTMYAWNSLHGDLYMAKADERIDLSIKRMKEIWLKEKEND